MTIVKFTSIVLLLGLTVGCEAQKGKKPATAKPHPPFNCGEPNGPPEVLGQCTTRMFENCLLTQIEGETTRRVRLLFAEAWLRAGGVVALGCAKGDEVGLPPIESTRLEGVDFAGALHQESFERGVIVSHFENGDERAFAERGPFRAAARTLNATSVGEKAFSMVPSGIVGEIQTIDAGTPIPVSNEEVFTPQPIGLPAAEKPTTQKFVLQVRYPQPHRLIVANLEWMPRVIPPVDGDGSTHTFTGKMWLSVSDSEQNPFWVPGRTPDVWRSMNCPVTPTACSWDLLFNPVSAADVLTEILAAPDPLNPLRTDSDNEVFYSCMADNINGDGTPYAGSSWRPVDQELDRLVEGIAAGAINFPPGFDRENCDLFYSGSAFCASVGGNCCCLTCRATCRKCEHFTGDSKIDLVPDWTYRYLLAKGTTLVTSPGPPLRTSKPARTEGLHTELEWLLWQPFGLLDGECPPVDANCMDLIGDRYRFVGRWVWDCEHGVVSEGELRTEMHPPDFILHTGIRPKASLGGGPWDRASSPITVASVHMGSGGFIRFHRRPRFGVVEFDVFPTARPRPNAELKFTTMPFAEPPGVFIPHVTGVACKGTTPPCTDSGVGIPACFGIGLPTPGDPFSLRGPPLFEPACDTTPITNLSLLPITTPFMPFGCQGSDCPLIPRITVDPSNPKLSNHIHLTIDFRPVRDTQGTLWMPLSYSDRYAVWWE
jgi:hypothetical protein